MTSGELCKRLREPLKELPTTLSDDEEVLILVAWCKEAADAIEAAEKQIEYSENWANDLEVLLRALMADVEEYQRINNLAPSPGKSDCWQSMINARAALKETP